MGYWGGAGWGRGGAGWPLGNRGGLCSSEESGWLGGCSVWWVRRVVGVACGGTGRDGIAEAVWVGGCCGTGYLEGKGRWGARGNIESYHEGQG